MTERIFLRKPVIIPGPEGVIPTLRNCYGVYDAEQVPGGGPLVGYAGVYEPGKHWVGFRYYNIAMAEQWTEVMDYWANEVIRHNFDSTSYKADVFLGIPQGGNSFAQSLARAYKKSDARFVFAEKIVTKVKTPEKREESHIAMNRHILLPGDITWEVEDVVNNYSSADKSQTMVEAVDSLMAGIICVINRSDRNEYKGKPVVSMVNIPTEQFRQDDPRVADKVARGEVFWKPKDIWMQEIFPLLPKAA